MIMMPYDWPYSSLQLTGQADFWHPTGLRGEGGFRANLGEGAQVHLDYWFE